MSLSDIHSEVIRKLTKFGAEKRGNGYYRWIDAGIVDAIPLTAFLCDWRVAGHMLKKCANFDRKYEAWFRLSDRFVDGEPLLCDSHGNEDRIPLNRKIVVPEAVTRVCAEVMFETLQDKRNEQQTDSSI